MGIFGVPLSVFLAGFAGALISLSFMPPVEEDLRKTLWRRARHVACGTLFAAYVTPFAVLGINRYATAQLPASAQLGLACIIGVVSMALIPIGLNFMRNKFGGAG